MKKHSLKDWMIAVRPWSFPASSMPVVVTLAYLYWMQQDINWVNGIWALLNIVVFHAAGNTWSDYFDYKHKVDARDTFGAKTLTDGMFAPREIYGLSMALLAVALVAGVGLLWRTGLPLLYIGIGGAACSLLYPPLKYRALGDVVIFLAYALLPTLGTCYVATGVVDWNVCFAMDTYADDPCTIFMPKMNFADAHYNEKTQNYFVAGVVLAGAVFILIRILFSTPSLVTYIILYAFMVTLGIYPPI